MNLPGKENFQEKMKELWPAGKGSVREVRRKCTKKDCPLCSSGERHLGYLLTYYKKGKQYSRHVPNGHIDLVRKMLKNGRKLEELLIDNLLNELAALRRK